ncbi:hypothetical protein GCM10011571_19240 [Marinithermofilum abyssi]|uniref:HTH marR-type domain-containing protein n=1 Tax=Marinithermofilum abyssi TaxID=1571185 RepID=A0A8J2VHS6_9BACL|nr:MarR family transcriptional regulator [Marinithermofilum abyssi]GGE17660.1 hypothetical protein GCM10011571_19240 [Marinithermofilum abyssi]
MTKRHQFIEELEHTLRRVFRTLKKEVNDTLGDEMNATEFNFLRYLTCEGPQKVSALSQKFGVAVSHVTNVADRLVEKKWVQRERSRKDKRVVVLKATPEGKEMFYKMEKKRKEYFRKRFDPFTTDEMETLLKLFQKLISGKDDGGC